MKRTGLVAAVLLALALSGCSSSMPGQAKPQMARDQELAKPKSPESEQRWNSIAEPEGYQSREAVGSVGATPAIPPLPADATSVQHTPLPGEESGKLQPGAAEKKRLPVDDRDLGAGADQETLPKRTP